MKNNYCPYATIDAKSNIIYQNKDFQALFNCNNSEFYDYLLFKPYKQMLSIQDTNIMQFGTTAKVLLINIFDKNIILNKYPIIVHNQIIGIQLVPEIFRINKMNNLLDDNTVHLSNISEKYKIITGYSNFQQEIIFCLISGFQSDKAIANFIGKKTNLIIQARSVSDGIKAIYTKLLVNNRDSLLFTLHYLNFNEYIPKSLFPPKVSFLEDLF